MFKRKYVKTGTEKGIRIIEDFLLSHTHDYTLSREELHSFWYCFTESKIHPSAFKRIGLNDIPKVINSSEFIVFSEQRSIVIDHTTNNVAEIICNNLNERMFFLSLDIKKHRIKQISVYIPNKEDTMLYINGIFKDENDMYIDDSESAFMREIQHYSKDFIKHHIQNDVIVSTNDLDFKKEFVTFTNLAINGSTLTFHYVP